MRKKRVGEQGKAHTTHAHTPHTHHTHTHTHHTGHLSRGQTPTSGTVGSQRGRQKGQSLLRGRSRLALQLGFGSNRTPAKERVEV